MFVVEPKQKFTLEQELGGTLDIKVYLAQHETYANGREFFDGQPLYVSFSGYNFRYANQPIAARPGDYIRFYYVNVGPNLTATFHAVGGFWNDSYSQGNPANKQIGGQSILASPSGHYVIDWQAPAERPNVTLPIPRIIDPFAMGSLDVNWMAHLHGGDPVLIQIVGNSFYPKLTELPAGTNITWMNEDVFDVLDGERSGKHSVLVTQGAETFKSPELLHADKFHYRSTKPGAYPLVCPLHPYMKSTVNMH